MKKTIFTGSCVAIVTPMQEDGSIHYDRLGAMLEEQIAAHTDAVCICGTTGESATMSDEEHIEAIRYTVKKVAGRIPVIAGAGSNHTDYAVFLSKEAKAAGADALLQVIHIGAHLGEYPLEQFLGAMRKDKKQTSDQLTAVLMTNTAKDLRVVHDVAAEEVADAVRYFETLYWAQA